MLHIVSTSLAFNKCRKYLQLDDSFVVVKKYSLTLCRMENNSIVKSKIDYNQFVELVIQHNKSITWQ
jgi:hypothetical protein